MKTSRTLSALGVVLFLMLSCVASAQVVPGKALIEYGWDVPHPSFVAENIREMEKQPFEGLIMRLPAGMGRVLANKKHDENAVAGEFEALANIKWEKFTDNFICMYAASTMDWFSDEDWECVLHNVGLCAKAAKVGRCKGVCFDAEPYGDNPWHYPSQAHADTKTFDEYQAIARKRGAQFIDKIEEYLDDPVIHTFFLMSYFRGFVDEPDPKVRAKQYEGMHYGLLPAFMDGMLDAIDPGTTMNDGNESSYYYQNAEQYRESANIMRNEGWKLMSPGNQAKYKEHVKAAQALYVDHLFDMRTRKNISAHMTADERAKWFEHNVYYALATSDRYVWLYSEKMNWWLNRTIPPGLPEAIVSAKSKLAKGLPLGYEMSTVIKRATQRRAEELAAKLLKRSADVTRAGKPTIDGILDDAVWKQVSALQAFVPYVLNKPETVKASTLAWLSYDDENLYVAVYCTEPSMDALNVVGTKQDRDVWLGDSVDLFLTPGGECRTTTSS